MAEQATWDELDTAAATAARARAAFLEAMSRAVTGVTVVATDGAAGRFGQTVSAMCSVSADPPLVLVCVNRRSPLAAAIRRNGVFSVNVLAADQTHVSDVFAGPRRHDRPYDFACATWESGPTGSPLLNGAVAAFDCALADAHEAGTHTIFIGRVLASRAVARTPLLYTQRHYAEPAAALSHRPPADRLADG